MSWLPVRAAMQMWCVPLLKHWATALQQKQDFFLADQRLLAHAPCMHARGSTTKLTSSLLLSGGTMLPKEGQ